MSEKFKKELIAWIKVIATALVFAFIITQFIRPTLVRGESMYPTLVENDYLIINRMAYKIGEPKDGDIIVFKTNLLQDDGKPKDLVKRVIATEGQHIKIEDSKVYVDDKLIDSTNYDSKTGSTVATLKDEYLKTLSVGEHTLKVAFSDNGEAITKFTIKEKQQNTNIEDNKNEQKQENNNLTNNDVQKENTIANPKTGDNVIVYFVMFSIAILGIITLAIVNTKRKKLRK